MMIHWHPDPVLFGIGAIKIRWYGLSFLTGFLLSLRIFKSMCAAEGRSYERLESLLLYVIAGTTVGARLGHCFFYEPAYFLAHPLEIFAIWNGGLASHGGGIGVMVAVFIFARRNREFPLAWILDRVAICTAMTGGFIRLGNLMNSEIIGKPTDANWGFIFERVDLIARHPTQLYESACYFLISLLGLSIYRYFRNQPPPLLIFGSILTLIFSVRFGLEFLKENQEAFENGMLINMGQLLSLPFIFVGLGMILLVLRKKSIPTQKGPTMLPKDHRR